MILETAEAFRATVEDLYDEISKAAAEHGAGRRVYLAMFSRDLLALLVGRSEPSSMFDSGMAMYVHGKIERCTDLFVRKYLLCRLTERITHALIDEELDTAVCNQFLPTP